MKFGGFVVLLAFVLATQARTIRKEENIPVEVRYEMKNGAKNLEEKVQLSHDHLKLAESEAVEEHKHDEMMMVAGNPNGVKNLQEKIQLSPEELDQVLKHLPAEDESKISLRSQIPLEKAEESKKPNEQSEYSPLQLFRNIEEIINSGLNSIKKNFESAPDNIVKPNEESWRDFNKTVQEIITNEYKNSGVMKQDVQPTNPPNNQNNIIQNVVNGFQNAATNFFQGLQGNQRPSGNGTEDEQTNPPSFFQNIFNQVQGVVSNINNLGGQSSTQSTVLGDTGTGSSTPPPNFINNVISSVQSFFGQNQQNALNNNQSDTGTGSNQPPNFVQGTFNQINQFVNNLRPTTSPPASGQGDEGSTAAPTNPIGGIIQNFQNQIGSAINQVSNFGSTNKPSGSEDQATGSTQGPNFIQSIGQAIQSANPFRPQQGPQGNNPITSGAQAVNNQIQQLVSPAEKPDSPQDKPNDEEKPVTEAQVAEKKKPDVDDKEKPAVKEDKKKQPSEEKVEKFPAMAEKDKEVMKEKEKGEIMETME